MHSFIPSTGTTLAMLGRIPSTGEQIMADNWMCSSIRGSTAFLSKMNIGSIFPSKSRSFEPNMFRSQHSGFAVYSRAASRFRTLSHTLRMGKSSRRSWRRQQLSVCLAMDASSIGGSDFVFPRMNVQDPYKRLGISREAGEDEIREARSYLAVQYGGHAKSMQSIESAYDEIMTEKLGESQKLQFKPRKEVKEMPVWMQKIASMYHVPSSDVIARTAAFYALLGLWTMLKPLGEGGPAFQVLISFLACIYFLNARVKSLTRSFFIGIGAFVIGWVLSSFFVPAIPPYVLPPPCTLERTSSLISYIILWAACTFLR